MQLTRGIYKLKNSPYCLLGPVRPEKFIKFSGSSECIEVEYVTLVNQRVLCTLLLQIQLLWRDYTNLNNFYDLLNNVKFHFMWTFIQGQTFFRNIASVPQKTLILQKIISIFIVFKMSCLILGFFLVSASRLPNLPIGLKWRDWVTSVITDDVRWFLGLKISIMIFMVWMRDI